MRCTALLLAGLVAAALAATSPIKHVIVLMEENRSFDHMLGHLASIDSRIDGLNGSQSNPVDPSDPNSPRVPVQENTAIDGGPFDPLHDFDSINFQLYGFHRAMNQSAPVTMSGFLADANQKDPSFVLTAHNMSSLPVLSTLALEYAVFDHWHCSCPCPTNPNREFLMSGTSHGAIDNSFPADKFPQQTHFAFLEKHGVSWNIIYEDDSWMVPAFQDLQTPSRLAKVQEMPFFYDALASGSLAQYTLIQPRMASSATGPSNWQHPDNSVSAGEKLISDIYAALRASRYWNDTLLIITYDEHGGFYDHQPPPSAPPPDGILASNGFDFSRLGVRIPTVMVSPWIARNTVVGAPTGAQAPQADSQFDATSIIATVNTIFGISENMTQRDAWAGRFHSIFDGSAPLRTDAVALPAVPPLSAAALALEGALPFNDHHFGSVSHLCGYTRGAHAVCAAHADARATQALVAALAAGGAPRADMAGIAAAFPHIAPGALPFLQQRHFGDLTRPLWAAYLEMVAGEA